MGAQEQKFIVRGLALGLEDALGKTFVTERSHYTLLLILSLWRHRGDAGEWTWGGVRNREESGTGVFEDGKAF